MATAAAVQQPPALAKEEEIDDDFVLIELVLDGSQRDKSAPNEADRSKKQNPKSGTAPRVPDSIPNFDDYEDFVEITVEEANLPESRSEDTKRSLYGVRLFQYSPESEGNIYITNEEL